jgi:hypothetical protein
MARQSVIYGDSSFGAEFVFFKYIARYPPLYFAARSLRRHSASSDRGRALQASEWRKLSQ